MTTRLSSKGQIVLPATLRQRLGLRSGDALDVTLESGRVVLTPKRQRKYKARIVKDQVTGFYVIGVRREAPKLTNEKVRGMLADFP